MGPPHFGQIGELFMDRLFGQAGQCVLCDSPIQRLDRMQ